MRPPQGGFVFGNMRAGAALDSERDDADEPDGPFSLVRLPNVLDTPTEKPERGHAETASREPDRYRGCTGKREGARASRENLTEGLADASALRVSTLKLALSVTTRYK